MTASPKAVSSSPNLMDGNKALAALFAAATASANPMQPQRILTMPKASSTPPKARLERCSEKDRPLTASKSQRQQPQQQQQQQQTQTMSASNLLSSLLNRTAQSTSSSSSSLPPTKTTATFTTTFAESLRATTSNASASATLLASKAGPSHHKPKPSVPSEIVNNPIELRNLESWFDEDAEKIDESQYQELADSGEANGWSADEMFKYNEKRHKIMSNFNHRTLSGRYTTALPKAKSKANADLATKLAAEIEERSLLQGRVTPESSDDDEQFEQERRRRIQQKQVKQQLDQLKNLNPLNNDQQQQQRINNHSQKRRSSAGKQGCSTNDHRSPIASLNLSARKVGKPNSQLSDSSATPATTSSTSSSPRPIDSSIISITSTKSTSSSSRNILRTSLA